jgi:hypothetical protein
VLKQIKDRVYKNRIRVKEFFADFDKLRCGSVTEAQVRAPLSLSHLLLLGTPRCNNCQLSTN